MFLYPIALATSEHLRQHLQAYLAEFSTLYGIGLFLPTKIMVSSELGGVEGENALPVYAVDAYTKTFSEQDEYDLNTWVYQGQITGLLGATTPDEVNKLVKGHSAACEKFAKEHKNISISGAGYNVMEMTYTIVETSGGQQVDNDGTEYWLAAFKVDLFWNVSEDGNYQHG